MLYRLGAGILVALLTVTGCVTAAEVGDEPAPAAGTPAAGADALAPPGTTIPVGGSAPSGDGAPGTGGSAPGLGGGDPTGGTPATGAGGGIAGTGGLVPAGGGAAGSGAAGHSGATGSAGASSLAGTGGLSIGGSGSTVATGGTGGGSSTGGTGSGPTGTILWSRTVDDMPLGPVTEDFLEAAWDSHYVKGEERTFIVEVTDAPGAGRAVEVRYSAGGVGSTPSGATWESAFGFESEELYLSYWVKFAPDFDFRHGGKLPGFGGSEGHPHGPHDFTMRLMWREEGRIEFYLHGFELPYETRTYWDDFGTHVAFVPGQWHHIETYLLLNTPGVPDGIMRGWLDGQLACEELEQGSVRGTDGGGTRINHLYFSTFFGGTSDPDFYAPTKEERAYFDHFLVSDSRLGYPGPR